LSVADDSLREEQHLQPQSSDPRSQSISSPHLYAAYAVRHDGQKRKMARKVELLMSAVEMVSPLRRGKPQSVTLACSGASTSFSAHGRFIKQIMA
jgi:hypothetical protein